MQVRKFEAPTMNEALQIIKQELGPDAIILSTKNHRKGFGLLSKASVEVTAAISEKSLGKKQLTEKIVTPQSKDQIRNLPAKKQAEVYEGFNNYYQEKAQKITEDKKNKEQMDALVQRVNSRGSRYIDLSDEEDSGSAAPASAGYGRNGRPPAAANSSSTKQVALQQSNGAYSDERQMAGRSPKITLPQSALSQEDMELLLSDESQSKTTVHYDQQDGQEFQQMREEMRRMKLMLEELKSEQSALIETKSVESSTDEVTTEFQNLLRNGVDRKYAVHLLKHVTSTLQRQDLKNPTRIVETIAVEMMSNIRVESIMDFQSGDQQRVYAIVGPTGVGKTTTIAKIAAQAILHKNLRVGLINVDSYKVAAGDQLSTYAKILNVPFRQASTAAELERALAEFKPLDLVLIDTSGRSQKDSESLTAMKQLLAEVAGIRTLLITSATTRDQELYDILNRFRIFAPTGLIFSKLDETSVFGCIYNLAVKTGLPLTYFGVGQRVPEDIEASSKERVIDLILDLD